MYRNVMIPIALEHTEGLEDSLQVARALLADGGEVWLLHVIEEMPGYMTGEMPQELIASSHEAARRELARIAEAHGGIEARSVVGHAGRTIIDEASKGGVDCVVLRSHIPEFADYFLGSTSARVVRHAPCSVMVIR